jgi:hypothetical protein
VSEKEIFSRVVLGGEEIRVECTQLDRGPAPSFDRGIARGDAREITPLACAFREGLAALRRRETDASSEATQGAHS